MKIQIFFLWPPRPSVPCSLFLWCSGHIAFLLPSDMSHFVLSEGFCISSHLYLGCSSLWHCHVSSSQSLWLEGHFLKRFALATCLDNIPLSPFCPFVFLGILILFIACFAIGNYLEKNCRLSRPSLAPALAHDHGRYLLKELKVNCFESVFSLLVTRQWLLEVVLKHAY